MGILLEKKKKKLEIIDSIGPHMIDYTPEVETDGKLESFPIDPKDTNKTLRIGKKSWTNLWKHIKIHFKSKPGCVCLEIFWCGGYRSKVAFYALKIDPTVKSKM